MMSDAIIMGSVAEELMDYVSTTPSRDSNYTIACTLLRNYSRLRDMTLGEIADLCCVSRPSISRFCRLFGFNSFKEFNEYLQMSYSISYDYSQSLFQSLLQDPQAALEKYSSAVIENIRATVAAENCKDLPQMAVELHRSRQLAYFSHHFLWDVGRQFQSKMMRMGRYVERYLDYGPQLECARNLGPEDMAIVCTVGGSYPIRHTNIWNALTASGCKVLVITQNFSSPFCNMANYKLGCGVSNRDDIGKYSALLAVEMLALTYLRQYGKEFL